MNRYKVAYMDRRGAGCMRWFADETSMEAFVKKLKCEAIIYFDDVKIGEVWRSDGECDDRRVVWLWAFERMEMCAADKGEQ